MSDMRRVIVARVWHEVVQTFFYRVHLPLMKGLKTGFGSNSVNSEKSKVKNFRKMYSSQIILDD